MYSISDGVLLLEWERESCPHQWEQGARFPATWQAYSYESACEEVFRFRGYHLGNVRQEQQCQYEVQIIIYYVNWYMYIRIYIILYRELEDDDDSAEDPEADEYMVDGLLPTLDSCDDMASDDDLDCDQDWRNSK